MSTRGLYGIRRGGVDKCIYNHYDSYPEGLGDKIISLCKNVDEGSLSKLYDLLISTENEEEAQWGILQYIGKYLDEDEPVKYVEYRDFISDSLMCEYAYIIDLDTHVLEFYKGMQTEPDENSRYGTGYNEGRDGTKYYPCRLMCVIPIELVRMGDSKKLIDKMNEVIDLCDRGERMPYDITGDKAFSWIEIKNRENAGDADRHNIIDAAEHKRRNYRVTVSYSTEVAADDMADAKSFVLWLIREGRLKPMFVTTHKDPA